MEYREGLDSNQLPIIGSKWKYQMDCGEAPLTVSMVDATRVFCIDKNNKPWVGVPDSFRKGLYTLLEVPSGKAETNVEQTTKSLDRKLGLDKEGRPIINSVWNGAVEGWSKEQSTFRIDGYNGTQAQMSKQLKDGSFTPPGNHAWTWSKIATRWELISVPDPDAIPTLRLIEKKGLYYEEQMRAYEKNAQFQSAKDYAKEAARHSKIDLAMLAEEKAVTERRVIREDQLKKLDTGDRRLFEAKVKPFVHYKDQMVGWLWWE